MSSALRLLPRAGLVFAFFLIGCNGDRVERLSPVAVLEGQDGELSCASPADCSLDFGLVFLGNSATRQIELVNLGDGALHVIRVEIPDGVSAGAQFALEGKAPQAVEPGARATLSLSFTPAQEGQHQSSLVIHSDDPERPSLQVALTGQSELTPSPQLQVCVPVDPADPDNQELDCSPPVGIAFGAVPLVPLGQPVIAPVILRNMGNELLNVQSVTLGAGSAQEFSLEPEAFSVQLQPLQVGSSPDEAEISVVYTPVDGGSDEGVLRIASSDPDDRIIEVPLSGAGIAPRICSDPLLLDFNRVAVDYSTSRSFSVTNCGLLPLTVGTIQFGEQSSPEFAFEALPLTPFDLQPEEQVDISVVYAPVDAGPDGGRVYMQSNDPSAESGFILLQGDGTHDPICDLLLTPQRLNFGAVEVGGSASKTAIISNAGTKECFIDDITEPEGEHPDRFVIASQPITPLVMQPGDSKQLTVRYDAADPGPDRATVAIRSDDYQEQVTSLDLYGNDPDVPECDIAISPTEVPFGVVAMWRTVTQEIVITNNGSEPCSLEALTFNPQTDPAFTISEAPSLPASIPAHESARVLVAFTPLHRALYAGQLQIVTSDPDSPLSLIGLSGAGEELNLMVVPDSLDFGRVTIGCNSPRQQVTVYNIGSTSVTINDVYLDPARTHESMQLTSITIDGNPANLPLSLAPSSSFVVGLRYSPADLDSHTGVLVIESTAAIGAYLEVPLQGEGTDSADQVDVFNQLDHPMVDVLWVIDNSGSMSPQQQALAQNFAIFINWAINLQTDFQIGVISTEINEPETPADYFNIYPGVLVYSPGFPRILTNTTPNLAQAFAKTVNVGTCCSDEQEAGIHAAMMALSEPLVTSPAANGGFLREDAKLVIVMVSDEADQSPAPVDFYVDFFRSIKGQRNDQLMDVSVIVGDSPGGCSGNGISAEAAPRYKYVQEATGGVFLSHCAANWGASLDALGLDSFAARTQFPLTRPAVPASISVTVDVHDGSGPQVVPEDAAGTGLGWEYDEPINSIVFGSGVVPSRGATIQVTYDALCL